MENDSKDYYIPFGKPVRVGNFKLWRSRMDVGTGKNKSYLEQVNVSSLDGAWQVKIPATVQMFSMIRDLYAETNVGWNQNVRRAQLSDILANMMYVSVIPNGYFHEAVRLCATAYANPSVLDESDEGHGAFLDSLKAVARGFSEWQKEYDRHAAEHEPSKEEAENESRAEEMMDLLSGGKN